MNNSKYFFAYNKNVYKYLHDVKGIEYITIAQDPRTQKVFTLFENTEEVTNALREYRKLKSQN